MTHRYGDHLSYYFEYDENSPSHLRWKVSTTRSVEVGDVAGTFDGSYWNVKLKGKCLKVHKVIWALYNDFIDQTDLEIDHKDGYTSNNKHTNLRLVNRPLNMRNRKMSARNCSGKFGVRERTDESGSVRYISFWCEIDGIQKSKSFSIKKYGERSLELATKHRDNQIERLNKSGAGYTNRHGEQLGEMNDQ